MKNFRTSYIDLPLFLVAPFLLFNIFINNPVCSIKHTTSYSLILGKYNEFEKKSCKSMHPLSYNMNWYDIHYSIISWSYNL
jgi:hypothetical protein